MELEKVCGEMALGYFKVLLKKREAEVISLVFIIIIEI